MPIYEYACPRCSARFEAYVQSFREPARCPSCGTTEVEKLLSSFAFTGTSASPSGGGCGCGRGGCGCHG